MTELLLRGTSRKLKRNNSPVAFIPDYAQAVVHHYDERELSEVDSAGRDTGANRMKTHPDVDPSAAIVDDSFAKVKPYAGNYSEAIMPPLTIRYCNQEAELC